MKTDRKPAVAGNRKERLYIAYGSNLNTAQMGLRCPAAEIVGTAMLRGWRLMFRGGDGTAVATIERCQGYKVPVLIWRLQPEDERALDRYEGWPHLYRKETLRVTVDGKRRSAMAYIMNEEGHPYGIPSAGYLEVIRQGYRTAGFDRDILHSAEEESRIIRYILPGGTVSKSVERINRKGGGQ